MSDPGTGDTPDVSERAGVSRRGLMLALSSPSGAGKTTISRELLSRDRNLSLSVSVTTRPPRPGEESGTDYFFVSEEEFQRLVDEGRLLEHAHVFDHRYGTPKEAVEAALAVGRDVLFDVDWQGTQQLFESPEARRDLVRVFILPPSTAELEKRLRSRAQDSREAVRRRMAKAADEMSHYSEYDYIVINRDIEDSVAQIQAILTAERLKRDRQVGLHAFVSSLCGGG